MSEWWGEAGKGARGNGIGEDGFAAEFGEAVWIPGSGLHHHIFAPPHNNHFKKFKNLTNYLSIYSETLNLISEI